MLNETPAVIVGEAVAGESAQTRSELEHLINNLQKSTLDVGELLYRVKSKNFYTSWGYLTFQEYIQSLAIKPRKSQYLCRIVEVMTHMGIPRTTYEPVGIAKLREISSLDPAATWNDIPVRDFITDLVANGQELPLEDIKRHVRTLKGFTGENDLVCKHWWFTQSALDNVIDPAIELTRKNIGTVGTDEEGMAKDATEASCVEAWATEYLNDPANGGE